jgi:hypothetical protein
MYEERATPTGQLRFIEYECDNIYRKDCYGQDMTRLFVPNVVLRSKEPISIVIRLILIKCPRS